MHDVSGKRREETEPVKHPVLEIARVLGKLGIPAFILKIVFVVVERSVAVVELVIVVAMPHGRRRRELRAIRNERIHLRRTLERIVRTIARQHAAARHALRANRTFRYEIDDAADSRTAELGRDAVLVDFNLLNVVEVHRTQVHGTTARIVERYSVKANQDIPRSDSANTDRLKTAHPPLLVALNARKRRKHFGSGKATAFPCRRKNFGIARTGNGNARRNGSRDLGHAKVLDLLCPRAGTAQKDRAYCGSAEGRRSHLSSFNRFPQFF